MGRYTMQAERTAATNETVGHIAADATTPRRQALLDVLVGVIGTPADNIYEWEVNRITTQGTSTGVTPKPLDPADAAALADAGENHSSEPTYTAGEEMLNIPLNQRSTFRWVAYPGSEIIVPATANNGLGLRTPTATALAVRATIVFEEQ